jgi:hypothetical protein
MERHCLLFVSGFFAVAFGYGVVGRRINQRCMRGFDAVVSLDVFWARTCSLECVVEGLL